MPFINITKACESLRGICKSLLERSYLQIPLTCLFNTHKEHFLIPSIHLFMVHSLVWLQSLETPKCLGEGFRSPKGGLDTPHDCFKGM